MATGKDILAVAAREIGYHEDADRRNKFGAWYGMDGVAWCMEFVQWCYAQAGAPLPYKTASCGTLLRWYRVNQPECIVKTPVPGCIVIFDFPGGAATDHTGLFVKGTDTTVTTIDGNTSGTNQSNGGWVQQKTRKLSYANPTYIVPRELEDEMDIDRFIREITPEQLQRLAEKAGNETCYTMLLKANEYAAGLATPEWMKGELEEAIREGITDGKRPLAAVQRGAAAIMALRASKRR